MHYFHIKREVKMSFEYKYNYPQIARDSGFKLRLFRDGPLDWRIVGSLEVEKILREQQFENIDAILFNLSEAPLAPALDSNVLDSGIAKYFILSQLAIQYLIFCRKFLDETVRTLRQSLIEIESENVNLKAVNQRQSNEILQLHKKISQIEAINDVVFPCHLCTKNFVSNDALNIHLGKKHPSTTTEAQCKDSDRTLIDTIKLELEIKHLKERLNMAEKDIRKTVENKKCSSTDIKTCSSTQVKPNTKDIGTQSNLCETKEIDCTNYEETNQSNMISQLQKAIVNIETWQETQRTENKESINKINQKLSEFTEALHARLKQDVDCLSKFTEETILPKISKEACTNDLHIVLSNTSELFNKNSEKLNEIISKIENIYKEKLPLLDSKTQEPNNLFEEQIRAESSQTTVLHSNSEAVEEIKSSISKDQKTYSVQKLYGLKESWPDERFSDTSQEVFRNDSNESPQSKSKSETSVRVAIKAKKKPSSLEKKITFFGVNLATKTISLPDSTKLLNYLTKNRHSLKSVYPQFDITRNKLKDLVDRFSAKRQSDRQTAIKSLSVSNNEIFKHFDAGTVKPKLYSISSNSEIEYTKSDSKRRLEKILSSPIKKPETYILNRTKETEKPIPLPRKRVMFHNEHKNT